jgi:repressor LexA
MTQEDLAKSLKVSRGAVSMWEINQRTPDPETLQKLADFFGCSVDYLLGRVNTPKGHLSSIPIGQLLPQAIPVDKNKLRPVPIYGVIRAGEPILANQELLGYDYLPEDEVKNGDYFYLVVKGDSMIDARISEGDLVLVRRQDWLDNGDIGVFIIDGYDATIKRYYAQDGHIILKPENSAYSPRIYKPDEVIILGKVVQLKVKFE